MTDKERIAGVTERPDERGDALGELMQQPDIAEVDKDLRALRRWYACARRRRRPDSRQSCPISRPPET
jgi:hypothetical protein